MSADGGRSRSSPVRGARRLRLARRLVFGPDGATGPSGRLRSPPLPWEATHRHRKGGLYRVLARGVLEAERTPCVIYDDAEGTIWVRPSTEFDDGRFTPV